MRAPLRRARTSARLTPLPDKLFASLAQFTHSMILGENHTHRQVQSAHQSRCLLILHFRETLLEQNHTHRQVPSAHHSHRSLIQRVQQTPTISLAQNHMHTERHHLPVAPVAGRPHSFHSHRITCTQKGAICPSLALLTHSALSGDTACRQIQILSD